MSFFVDEREDRVRVSAIVLTVVGVLVVSVLLWGVGYAFSWWAAPWQGKLEAREQVQSGNYRIAAYNHFYDLCASVQTADNNIATQEDLLAQVDGSDRSRVLTNIAALKSVRADGINQYNVDARKTYTEGQFLSSDLPYQLPAGSYTKGESISCTASGQ
jgi:hypothetical protein